MVSAVDADPPLFYLFYITRQKYKPLGVFPRTHKAVVEALDIDDTTAVEAIRLFCSQDEERLLQLVRWRST